ncbi:MAG: flagellar basal body L-ring protein FlgH [Leptolyngbya sp. PLA3]|nr:MAG: flagellar basal body L-ring protein FlgH [Cyanobacteria bacterium CYA]MCE7968144.1 flagellar basal body L-ring protein FlgH [Leptolyngbya sp. PL-A3]
MRTAASLMLIALTSHASAQSVLLQALEPAPPTTLEERNDSEFARASMLYVHPPEPRTYMAHDLITIIVDETSKQEASQSLDTKKEATADMTVKSIIDPWELLELRLREGSLSNQSLVGTNFNQEFKGEGDYERSDRFSAKITAEVIEVKPNGTLVLQATKVIQKDKEIQTLVLSGLVRQEDVTDRNTILSSQMANLSLNVKNEGDVRSAAEKGLLTRVLEAVFSF